MGSAWPPDGYEDEPLDHDGIPRTVFRLVDPTGPPVLLFHELGGLNDLTLAWPARSGAAGLSPVLPALVGPPGRMLADRNLRPLCASLGDHDLGDWRDEPDRRLAAPLASRESDPPRDEVGVMGMCFSGGFALAMAVDPA